MRPPREPFDSTIVRRGTDAARLSELAAFVADLERRPLPKLAAELPGFMRLSERKRDLVRQILRLRLRKATAEEKTSFRNAAIAAATEDGASGEDVAAILDSVGA